MKVKYPIAAALLAVWATSSMPAFAQETVQAVNVQPQGALTLQAAIARAIQNAPQLQAASARSAASLAARQQAGALPNPEFSFEAENIMGDGAYSGFDSADMTYGISQLIELPGKRGNRVKMADADSVKAHLSGDTARLDLIRDITIAYVQLAAAQQDVDIREEEARLTEAVFTSVTARVDAGKEPAIQRNKAKIAQTSSQIALDRARRALQVHKKTLASLMGGGTDDFTAAAESLPVIEAPQPLDAYANRLTKPLDLQAYDADVTRAEASVSYEKASVLPDPTLSIGLRDMRGDDSQAFVAGISIPIPVFNANRGNIRRAGQELTAAMADRRAAELSLASELAQLHGDFLNAYHEAYTLQTSVIAGAEEAFSFAQQGYAAGKFGYLDVLDAQRTLFETRQQLNAATADYHTQRAQIERLIAAHENDAPVKE